MATPTYIYPTSAELETIDPILMAGMIADDPLIGPNGLFPIEETDADRLIWEQMDSYNGLMQFRGLNGSPPRVKRDGSKRFEMVPGAYGEFSEVDEREMTIRAAPGTWHLPIPIKDLTDREQERLMVRQTNLMRWICAQLLTQGTFVVLDKDGAIGAQDSYKQQIYTPAVSWTGSPSTARPLYDLRQIPILGRGQSTNFGSAAQLWVTQVGLNAILNNQNANDVRGERIDGGNTVETLGDLNRILGKNNLPQIVVYEEGYLDASGTFQTFIPDTIAVLVGRRQNNRPLGRFRMTRNLASANGRGAYTKIIERGMAPDSPPPPKLEIHRGLNGGPILQYPGSIFIIKF